MATEYTPNYNLDLYASADKPNLRDQYNAAMGKIDTQMKKSAEDVTNANANVLTLQTQMGSANQSIASLQEDVQGMQTDVGTLSSTVSSHTLQIETINTSVNGLRNDVNGLNGKVSGLQTGKAPTNHASTSATYGLGTASSYGHVRLSDVANDSQNVSDGVGVTPYALNRLWQYLQLSTPNKVFDSDVSASNLNVLNTATGSLTAAPTGFDNGNAVVFMQHNSDYSIVRVYGRVTVNPSGTAQVPTDKYLVFVVPGIKLPNTTFRTVNYTGQYSYMTKDSEMNVPFATSSFLLADGRFALGILATTSAITYVRAYYWQTDIIVNPLNW